MPDTAAPDTKWPDLPAVRKAAEEAIRQIEGTAYFPVTAAFLLSLLDRIEELEGLLRALESTIAHTVADTWTAEQIKEALRQFREELERPRPPLYDAEAVARKIRDRLKALK